MSAYDGPCGDPDCEFCEQYDSDDELPLGITDDDLRPFDTREEARGER